MYTPIDVSTIMELSGNKLRGKSVNTIALAQVVHECIFQKGCIMEKKVQEWVKPYLQLLANAIQAFGENASTKTKEAYALLLAALEENNRRITRRPRQKSVVSVAVAA